MKTLLLLFMGSMVWGGPLDSCAALFQKRVFAEAALCAEARLVIGLPVRADSVGAMELCAQSAYLLEDYKKCGETFDRLLNVFPGYRPDPAELPPELVALFSSRLELQAKSNWRFVPFGAGQWKAGKKKRAAIFAGTGLGLLLVNAGTYNIRKSMENPDGTYTNPDKALNLYRIQISAAVLFALTGLVSVTDAVLRD